MSHVKISEPKDDKRVFTLPVGIPINVPEGVHEPETKGPTKRTKIGDQNEKIESNTLSDSDDSNDSLLDDGPDKDPEPYY